MSYLDLVALYLYILMIVVLSALLIHIIGAGIYIGDMPACAEEGGQELQYGACILISRHKTRV